jgi:surface polysaccharide O-acyltransferase-like enzyme
MLTGYFHLWYINALIVGVAILYFLKKRVKNNGALLITAILLIVAGYIIQKYFFHFMSIAAIRQITYRNALFVGFPYVFFGYFIRKTEKKMALIKKPCLFFTLIAGFTLLLLESYLSDKYFDIYLSLIILCPAIFFVVLKFSKYSDSSGYVGKLASGVFFVHIVVIFKFIQQPEEGNIYVLPLIFFLSMIASAGIIEINKRIKVFL